MKVIIAGSRSITDRGAVMDAVDESPFDIDVIMHGDAKGVDQIAGDLMKYCRADEVKVFPPDHDKYEGWEAPLRRNTEMAENADALIAVWNGESPGTQDMIEKALDNGLDVYVKQVE